METQEKITQARHNAPNSPQDAPEASGGINRSPDAKTPQRGKIDLRKDKPK